MAKKKETTKRKEPKKEKVAEVKTSSEFNLDRFKTTQFVDRTAEVPVPDMKDFYPAGTKPVIVVKNLTALELARVDDAVKTNQEARNEATVKALSSEAVEALRTLLRAHVDEGTPDKYVQTLNIVQMGMVKPKMEYADVIKFATAFPVEFRVVFMKINELTGKGMDFKKKRKGSG